MERHVLVLFPHPDDETMAVGGAVAYHAAAGSPITYACFTLGEMGRNMGHPFFATRESLPAIREMELREACKALGIDDLRLLGFRDKTLEFEDPEKLADIIEGLISELQPSLIITYYPGYCVHPDHEAIAAATVKALQRLPEEKRPVLQCQAFSQGHAEALGERDVVIDTSPVWERVYQAWRAHRSQAAAWVERMETALSGSPQQRQEAIGTLSTTSLYTLRV
ncbi:MAG: bacillithiol biosynthesis deacetylase BshB2 [Firmicutes bacterium]|nr:bacillithiol biosynthesis deacetylase BshB2 [Bacillota bacterium]